MKFRIDDNKYESYTREPNPNDSWDRGDTYTSHHVNGIVVLDDDQLKNKRSWWTLDTKLDVKPGDDVYLVWVVYNTGSTFGTAEGNVKYVDIFTDKEEAYDCVKAINNHYTNHQEAKHLARRRGRPSPEDEWNVAYTHNGGVKTIWASWNGYFESLTDVRCQKFELLNEEDAEYLG